MLRLSFACIFLLFISCKKDNKGNSIIGKWQVTDYFDGYTAWGGCNCWKPATAALKHTVEFYGNGTYKLTPPPISSFSGCTGAYQLKNDSTLRWNRCGSDESDVKISFEPGSLLIEEPPQGGFYIYKYKRLR